MRQRSPEHLTNRRVVIESNRLLLECSTLPYVVSVPFSGSKDRIQKIDRSQLSSRLDSTMSTAVSIKAVYGIVQLQIYSYLIVVRQSLELAAILNRSIYRVERVEFIPIAEKTAIKDIPHIEALQSLFDLKQFYYSDTYDLTSTADRAFDPELRGKEESYFYNREWVNEFLEIKAEQWITRFISGGIERRQFTLNRDGIAYHCDLILISRRDRKRQGARWLCRGTDGEGNAVNTVLTQQILAVRKGDSRQLYSFVQIRGSIPYLWQQKPNLRWTPKCLITGDRQQNSKIVQSHFSNLKRSYPETTIINLVSKTKKEQKMLGQEYQTLVNELRDENIRFVWFDFLSVCKNMKYQNLSQLMEFVKVDIKRHGYTHIIFQGQVPIIKQVQKGVFRTNCMDCLDRTNVVQSVIARNILHKQLNKMIEYNQEQTFQVFQKLPNQIIQKSFRQAWTRNGDVISVLYAGTPAMKSDFTLNSERTFRGAVRDGIFAIKRYSLGNFYDFKRQNANDILIKKLNLKTTKVREQKTNTLFLLLVCMITTPIVVNFVIDWIVDSDPIESLRPNVRDKIISDWAVLLYKAIGCVGGMLSIFKIFQSESHSLLNLPTVND